MALVVACLTSPAQKRYRLIAEAMAAGIARCGDRAKLVSMHGQHEAADVGVMYGWKRHAKLERYPRFVYADLGYWHRDRYYRLAAGGWGPESYVRAGLPTVRFESLGLQVKPWREEGTGIIVAGATAKAAIEHGLGYTQWERQAIAQLQGCGRPVVYRPKPNDPMAAPLPGAGYDTRPISEALSSAWAWVTHHSNSAVDALLAGIPVHCEIGAAAAMSVPLDQIAAAPLPVGREQFLADVAWLQWTVEEMRSGEAWAHLKERGLVC